MNNDEEMKKRWDEAAEYWTGRFLTPLNHMAYYYGRTDVSPRPKTNEEWRIAIQQTLDLIDRTADTDHPRKGRLCADLACLSLMWMDWNKERMDES